MQGDRGDVHTSPFLVFILPLKYFILKLYITTFTANFLTFPMANQQQGMSPLIVFIFVLPFTFIPVATTLKQSVRQLPE